MTFKMLARTAAIACVLLLSACAVAPEAPTEEQLRTANYGPELTVAQADATIREHLKRTLIDFESARYGGPTKVSRHWARDSAGKLHYGYLAPYRINAKNRMGGYVGEQLEAVFIENGKIRESYEYRGGRYWFPSLDQILR